MTYLDKLRPKSFDSLELEQTTDLFMTLLAKPELFDHFAVNMMQAELKPMNS